MGAAQADQILLLARQHARPGNRHAAVVLAWRTDRGEELADGLEPEERTGDPSRGPDGTGVGGRPGVGVADLRRGSPQLRLAQSRMPPVRVLGFCNPAGPEV
jgi:hypothetical protein